MDRLARDRDRARRGASGRRPALVRFTDLHRWVCDCRASTTTRSAAARRSSRRSRWRGSTKSELCPRCMPVPITALYAGLLALLMLALAIRIIRLRWKLRVGIGDGGDKAMSRAIRVHGNATEHVPIALMLMLVAELNHATPMLLHACGIVLVVAQGPACARTGALGGSVVGTDGRHRRHRRRGRHACRRRYRGVTCAN